MKKSNNRTAFRRVGNFLIIRNGQKKNCGGVQHNITVTVADLHLNIRGVITGRFRTTEPNFSEVPENKLKNWD